MKYYVLSFASDDGTGTLQGIYDDAITAQQANTRWDVCLMVELPDDIKPQFTIFSTWTMGDRRSHHMIDIEDKTTWTLYGE